MKESASPPRTPNSHSPSDMKSHSPTAPALVAPDESSATTATATATTTSSSQLLTAPTFILPQSEANVGGRSQLDIEFPKLTPPKTKVGWNSSSQTASGARNTNNRKSVSSDTSSNNNSLCEDINESHMNDKMSQKSGSQTISISTVSGGNCQAPTVSPQQSDNKQKQHSHVSESECEKASNESYNMDERAIISPSRTQCKSPNNYSQNHNDNNNNGGGGKSSMAPNYPINVRGKPPLKNMGSSSSCEGGNTSSGFISRDSSSEQFVDQNGIDLVQFFKETLNKNSKDRNMLMKIERELLQLAVDQT
jgi:a component of the cytoplasm (encore)